MATPPIVNCDTCGGAPAGTPLPTWVKICADSPGGGGGGGGGGAGTAVDVEKVPVCYTVGAAPQVITVPENTLSATTHQTTLGVGAANSMAYGWTWANDATARQLFSAKHHLGAVDDSNIDAVWEVWESSGAGIQATTAQTIIGVDPTSNATRIYQSPSAPWTGANRNTHTFSTPVNLQANTTYWIVIRVTKTAGTPTGMSFPVYTDTSLVPNSREVFKQVNPDAWSVVTGSAVIGDLSFQAAAPSTGTGSGGSTASGQEVLTGFLEIKYNGVTGAPISSQLQDAQQVNVTDPTAKVVPCAGATIGNRPDLEPVCYRLPADTITRQGFIVVSYDNTGTESARVLQDATGAAVANGTVVACDGGIDIERMDICYRSTGTAPPVTITIPPTTDLGINTTAQNDPDNVQFAQEMRFTENRTLEGITAYFNPTSPVTAQLVLIEGDDPTVATPTVVATGPVTNIPASPLEYVIPLVAGTTLNANQQYTLILNIGSAGAVPVNVRTRFAFPDNPRIPGNAWWSSNAGNTNILSERPNADMAWTFNMTIPGITSAETRTGHLVITYDKQTGAERTRRIEDLNGTTLTAATIVPCISSDLDIERTEVCYNRSDPIASSPVTIAGTGTTNIVTAAGTATQGFAQTYVFPEQRRVSRAQVSMSADLAGRRAQISIYKGDNANSLAPTAIGQSQSLPIPTSTSTLNFLFADINLDANESHIFVMRIADDGASLPASVVVTNETAPTPQTGLGNAFQKSAADTTWSSPGALFAWDLTTETGGVVGPLKGYLVVVHRKSDGTEQSRRIEDRLGATQANSTIVDCPADQTSGTTLVDIERHDICYTTAGTSSPANLTIPDNTTNSDNFQNPTGAGGIRGFFQQWTFADERRIQSLTARLSASVAGFQATVLIYRGSHPSQLQGLVGQSNIDPISTTFGDHTFTFSGPVLQAGTSHIVILQVSGTVSGEIISETTNTPPPELGGAWEFDHNDTDYDAINTRRFSWDAVMTTGGTTAPTPGYLVVLHNRAGGAEISRSVENRAGAVVANATIVDCPLPTRANEEPTPVAPVINRDIERNDVCYQVNTPAGPVILSLTGDNVSAIQTGTQQWVAGFAQQFNFTSQHTLNSLTIPIAGDPSGMPGRVIVREGTDPNAGNIIATSGSNAVPNGITPTGILFGFVTPPVFQPGQDYMVVLQLDATGQPAPNVVRTNRLSTHSAAPYGQAWSRVEQNPAGWATLNGAWAWQYNFNRVASTGPVTPGYMVVVYNPDGTELSRRVEDRTGTVQANAGLVDCAPKPPVAANMAIADAVITANTTMPGGFIQGSLKVLTGTATINGALYSAGEAVEFPYMGQNGVDRRYPAVAIVPGANSSIRIHEVR